MTPTRAQLDDERWRPWRGPTVACPRCGPSTAVSTDRGPACAPCGAELRLGADERRASEVAQRAWDEFEATGMSEHDYMAVYRREWRRRLDEIDRARDEERRQGRLYT